MTWFSTKQASTKGIWENEFMRFSEDLRFNEDWGTIWEKGSAKEGYDLKEGIPEKGSAMREEFGERGKRVQRWVL